MTNAESDFLKRKIAEIEQDFIDFNNDAFKFYESKKQRLIDWVEALEKQIAIGDLTIQVNEISRYLRARKDELNLNNISESWFKDAMPARCKRDYDKIEKAGPSIASVAEVPRQYQKPVAAMKNEEVRAALTFYDEQAKELSRRKTEANEKVQELIEASHARGLAIDKVERPVVSTRKQPGQSNSLGWADSLVDMATGIRDKIRDFPPQGSDDEELALSLEQLCLFLRPMQDEKWTKSLVEWFKVQIENIAYGKHAAGSRQASITLMGDRRNMTREQVGDRFDEVMKMACKITGDDIPDESDGEKQEEILKRAIAKAAAHPQVNKLAEWHKKYVEPRIAQRKVDKHDDFSEAA